ncbi:peptidoglycan bridge formation glycyltransferase FemA/FemB family protein [Sphingomonas sp.]|uniref:peptidoglycan bridge formation glycyltransferase FemA/FemB family protein n=1 Tax=Sphingomonas sp. TaxID=28214 RepID=UPI0035C792B5
MTYRSIFMAPEWMHVRHLGWHDHWPDPKLRVMTQRRGGMRRALIVSELDDPEEIARHWHRIAAASPFAETRFHDLTDSPRVGCWLKQQGLGLLDARQRMLNVSTLVIDLQADERALLARLSSDTRRNIKRAEAAGLTVLEAPAESALFIASFNTMAAERGLQPLDAARVEAMLASGHSRLFATMVDGAPRSFLLSYETGETALIATTAAAARERDGGGHLLHWRAMCAFRARGLRWCDMGGIVSTDARDGIYQFKRGFGGELVDLGQEYGRTGPAVRIARAVRQRLRR